MVSLGSDEPAFFAVGQEARGFIAIGQFATGVLAIGQLATGVVAIGQLARGGVAVGQGALGLVTIGMVSAGVLRATGMIGMGGVSGRGLLVYGLFPRPFLRRALAWLRREPWDDVPGWPARWVATRLAVLAGLAVAWWFGAGQAVASLQLLPAGNPRNPAGMGSASPAYEARYRASSV
jgi:hypothetical protein